MYKDSRTKLFWFNAFVIALTIVYSLVYMRIDLSVSVTVTYSSTHVVAFICATRLNAKPLIVMCHVLIYINLFSDAQCMYMCAPTSYNWNYIKCQSFLNSSSFFMEKVQFFETSLLSRIFNIYTYSIKVMQLLNATHYFFSLSLNFCCFYF